MAPLIKTGNCDVQTSYLHLHHLPFAAGAKGPLVADNAVVVGTLVSVQGDRVLGKSDDLIRTGICHRLVIHSFVHSQVGSGGIAGTVRVHYSETRKEEEEV